MRMPENDLLPASEYFGIGVAPYSPLARGVLSGKYDPAKKPPRNSRAATPAF
jgi:aryl-alcohol dehydrogenase (NADP+)